MIENSFSESQKGLYRKNVGVVLINSERKIFVGRRFGVRPDKISWQMPQGGMLADETEEETMIREIQEEIGLLPNSFEIVKKSARHYYYTIPPMMRKSVWQNIYVGQRQRWFLVKFTGKDENININGEFPEFESWSWKTRGEIMSSVVHFKKEVYTSVFNEFEIK